MNEADCSKVIKERGIKNKEKPKKKNSFIIAIENEVQAICQGKSGRTNSTERFDVIVCTLIHEDYMYEGSWKPGQRLEVECDKNLPVHFYRQEEDDEEEKYPG
uniref:Ribonuclease A-domain domain-containing protein n=1 Tax=Cyprinodon variegatus TaxID=28743 RepID=A0A3Q2E396_CYPVA